MNTISTSPDTFESTYALLVRSEEKQRSRFETLIYVLLVVSAAFAVSQFGHHAAIEHSARVDDLACRAAARRLTKESLDFNISKSQLSFRQPSQYTSSKGLRSFVESTRPSLWARSRAGKSRVRPT